jgi:hypothetical protein
MSPLSRYFAAILFILLGYILVDFSFGCIHYEPLQQMFQNFAMQ